MRKRFAVSAVLVTILLAATCALGQSSVKSATASKGGKSARIDARLADLSQQLQLTEDQKAKIKPILQEESTKLHGVKNNAALSPEEKKAQSGEIRRSALSQIRALLNPDQQTKLDGMPTTPGKIGKRKAPQPNAN